MAKMTLREYANKWLKDKGKSASEAKKDAGKYKSIAAAKKAGSLYYTNKDGKTMLAVYAEDLDRATSVKPKLRPKTEKKTGTPTKRLDTKGDTPAKKKATSVEDLTFTATAAIDGKSGVQGYIDKLEKQLTELRAAAEAKRKRNVVPRTEEAKIRSIEGSIRRIKEKQGMSKGGMAKKKMGMSKGGMTDYRKSGMFYGGMAKKR
jgi:hypothetical protein